MASLRRLKKTHVARQKAARMRALATVVTMDDGRNVEVWIRGRRCARCSVADADLLSQALQLRLDPRAKGPCEALPFAVVASASARSAG